MMAFLFLLGWVAAECTPVHGISIQGRDLAAADSAFSSVAPEAVVGYAPAPGLQRRYSEAEMARLAKQLHVEAAARELCFTYPVQPLVANAVEKAMQEALPGASIELVEMMRAGVPDGSLRFPLASLSVPAASQPEDPVLWRGSVEYAANRRIAVWARVRVRVNSARVVTLKDTVAGDTILAANVELRQIHAFPGGGPWAQRVEDVAGRKALRGLRAGDPIPASGLQPEGQAISRGDLVTVDVEAGAARIRISARAETAAGVGEPVKLRNVKSGKIFEARVTGKDAALVIAGEEVQ